MITRRRELELRDTIATLEAEIDRRDSDPLERRVGEHVVVHLENRQSVAGILAATHATSLVLHAARLLVEGSGAIQMDGTEHVVPRGRITIVNVGVTIDDARLQA